MQIDFLSLFLVVGDLERRAGAPGQPADAVGPGRGEQPPLARLGAGRQQALVKRTLRHPIRGDRLHPKPSNRPARRRSQRHEARQPRMRPRKSVNVASIVGSPEEEESRPNLRLRIVGVVVLLLFGVLVLRLWTLQVVEGKTYAAAVTRNQVRVVERPGAAWRDRRPQRHGARLQHPAAGDPALAGRGGAEPEHRRHGGRAGRTDAQAGAGVHQQQPVQPVRAGAGRGRRLARHGAVPADATRRSTPVSASRPWRSAPTPRAGPRPPTSSATWATSHRAIWPPTPTTATPRAARSGCRGSRPSTSPTCAGSPGARRSRWMPAARSSAPSARRPPRSATPWCSTSTPACSRRCRTTSSSRSWPTARRPTQVDGGRLPAAPNGAAIVMNPQNGQVLALASYPTYDLNEWVGGISSANFAALQASGAENNNAIEGQYTPGSTFKLVTATAALQDGLWSPTQYYDDTGTFKIPGCPAPGVNNDTGCVLHDDPGDSGGTYDISGALTVSSDSFFYNLGDLFWQDRAQFGDTPIQNEATAYGEGTITGIDLPGEAQGRVDSYLTRAKLHAEAPKAFPYAASWFTGDNIEMAFGQGETVLTPIEQAVAYSTFANGGTRYAPQVASEIVDPVTGKVVKKLTPQVTGHVAISPTNYAAMLQGFEGVISSPHGTAYGAFQGFPASWNLAGKTGTASNQAGEEPNSWFVAFGPNPNPQYVVLAVIDQGGYGADAAAPLVRNIFDYLAANPISATVKTPTPASPPSQTAPPSNPPLGTPTTTTTTPGAAGTDERTTDHVHVHRRAVEPRRRRRVEGDGVPVAADRAPPARRVQARPLHRRRAGGRVPRARARKGGLALGLPRHLRDRPAQPGPADPLRDPQRASRRAGRAGLRALGRHGGRHAGGRRAPVQRRAAPARGRLRRAGLQPLGRARLHERPEPDRPGGPPAARGGPRRCRRPRRGRRPLRLQPRAAGRLRRRLRPGRRRGGRGRGQRGAGRLAGGVAAGRARAWCAAALVGPARGGVRARALHAVVRGRPAGVHGPAWARACRPR